uniref:Uncharacterized protein n=1 Tax=Oryza punctata TaxID=4537 RepID=A0A0E0LX59_ORYPU
MRVRTSGGWRSALFVAVLELAGSFAYFGVSANLITYLTAAAAAGANAWSGTAGMLPLLGAFLGRYRCILSSPAPSTSCLADEDKGDVRGGGRLKGFPTETEATGSRFSNHVKNNGSWFHEDSNHLEHISQSKGDVHGPLQLAPTRKENTLIASGHVVERTVSAVLDIIKPEDKVATEDKGKDRNRDVVYDKADDINSLASIEEILKLHFKAEMIEKRCQNCSNAAQKASPISDKHGEQMVACTNVNRTVDGDQQALCCLCDTKSRAADQWLFGSSLWFCASDAEIREISLEEVLKCEALPSFLREDGRLRCLESTSC